MYYMPLTVHHVPSTMWYVTYTMRCNLGGFGGGKGGAGGFGGGKGGGGSFGGTPYMQLLTHTPCDALVHMYVYMCLHTLVHNVMGVCVCHICYTCIHDMASRVMAWNGMAWSAMV